MTESGIKRPFLIRIPALYDPDTTMTTEEIYELQKPWRDNIHEAIRKMQPRLKTPEEVAAEKYQAHLQKIREKMFPHTRRMLETLRADPYLTKTQLLQGVGGSEKAKKGSINILLKLRLVETVEFALKTRPAEYFPLTEKAHDLMESTPEDRKHCPLPEYFIHRMVCDKIAEHIESIGLKPKREFAKKGMKKRIDVAVNRGKDGKDDWLAIEAMTTDLYYLDKTLEKCLNHMMMDEVIIVTKTAEERDKAKAIANDTTKLKASQKDRVRFMSVKEILTKFDPRA